MREAGVTHDRGPSRYGERGGRPGAEQGQPVPGPEAPGTGDGERRHQAQLHQRLHAADQRYDIDRQGQGGDRADRRVQQLRGAPDRGDQAQRVPPLGGIPPGPLPLLGRVSGPQLPAEVVGERPRCEQGAQEPQPQRHREPHVLEEHHPRAAADHRGGRGHREHAGHEQVEGVRPAAGDDREGDAQRRDRAAEQQRLPLLRALRPQRVVGHQRQQHIDREGAEQTVPGAHRGRRAGAAGGLRRELFHGRASWSARVRRPAQNARCRGRSGESEPGANAVG